MRIFCELRRRGEEKYEQWAKCPLVLYAKPSNKGSLFQYKKNCYFAIGFYFLVRVFRNILIPSVRMMLTISKICARSSGCQTIICQTIEWEVNYSTEEIMLFWLLFSIIFSSAGWSSSAIVAPFASAGIHPVVNWLNQDTTVYYGLVFCAFAWPYMVKWHNSGIIKQLIS